MDMLCEICGATFSSGLDLITHKTSVHRLPAESRNSVGCEYLKTSCMNASSSQTSHSMCGQSFKDRDLLSHHKRNAHSKKHKCGNTATCVMCDKVCSTKGNLTRHMREVHNTGPDNFKEETALCPRCKMSLLNIKFLDEHLKTVHEMPTEVEELLFPSREEFYQWKRKMEVETSSHFIQQKKHLRAEVFTAVVGRGRVGRSSQLYVCGGRGPTRLALPVQPEYQHVW